jgi:hypothetical protein
MKKHVKLPILAIPLAMLATAVIPPPTFARVAANTIDPQAVISENGRHLIVTGPLQCTAHEGAPIDVTVTQRSTGAVAKGRAVVTCTGDMQQWKVRAATRGRENFEPGPATAVAIARTTVNGHATDAHQWLVNITLVEQ